MLLLVVDVRSHRDVDLFIIIIYEQAIKAYK